MGSSEESINFFPPGDRSSSLLPGVYAVGQPSESISNGTSVGSPCYVQFVTPQPRETHGVKTIRVLMPPNQPYVVDAFNYDSPAPGSNQSPINDSNVLYVDDQGYGKTKFQLYKSGSGAFIKGQSFVLGLPEVYVKDDTPNYAFVRLHSFLIRYRNFTGLNECNLTHVILKMRVDTNDTLVKVMFPLAYITCLEENQNIFNHRGCSTDMTASQLSMWEDGQPVLCNTCTEQIAVAGTRICADRWFEDIKSFLSISRT